MGIITDLSLRWLYRLTDLIHIKCFLVAQLVKNPPAMLETPVRFSGPENLLEKG